ncbi:zf-TFIIB domain containing protein, partial [Streptomyces tricolor]|nr:zf-TFIIB domain containing protein [Streptomyces tricolor]
LIRSGPGGAPRGAPPAPAWGAPQGGHGHYGHHRHKSFGHMLFSS